MELSVEGQAATFTFSSTDVLYTSWSNGVHSADCSKCDSFLLSEGLDEVQDLHAAHVCPMPVVEPPNPRSPEQILIDASFEYTGLESTPAVQ